MRVTAAPRVRARARTRARGRTGYHHRKACLAPGAVALAIRIGSVSLEAIAWTDTDFLRHDFGEPGDGPAERCSRCPQPGSPLLHLLSYSLSSRLLLLAPHGAGGGDELMKVAAAEGQPTTNCGVSLPVRAVWRGLAAQVIPGLSCGRSSGLADHIDRRALPTMIVNVTGAKLGQVRDTGRHGPAGRSAEVRTARCRAPRSHPRRDAAPRREHAEHHRPGGRARVGEADLRKGAPCTGSRGTSAPGKRHWLLRQRPDRHASGLCAPASHTARR
jgi:hypothetical protein